jgi:hypothetical protein
MNKLYKKVICLALTIVPAVSIALSASAISYPDSEAHWASDLIELLI